MAIAMLADDRKWPVRQILLIAKPLMLGLPHATKDSVYSNPYKLRSAASSSAKARGFRRVIFLMISSLLGVCGGMCADQTTVPRVVLISGASSGIGEAATRVFHHAGWHVWGGSRHPATSSSPTLRTCRLDVTDAKSVEECVGEIIRQEGRLDLLINNAWIGLVGGEESVTIEEVQHLFDVNVFGVLRLTQAVLPIMRSQRSGLILNISSLAGIQSLPGIGAYASSKWALEGLTESLAATVEQWGIQVVSVQPGFVGTHFAQNSTVGTRACNEPWYAQFSEQLCRWMDQGMVDGQSAEDVARLLLKIAEDPSPQPRYQTTKGGQKFAASLQVDPTGSQQKVGHLQFLRDLQEGGS